MALSTPVNFADLYLDMDGVFVDFMRGAHAVLHDPFDSLDWKNDIRGHEDRKQIIRDHGGLFWETLPWMPDGKHLWDFCKHFNPHILSAYAEWDPSSRVGKLHWIKTHFGDIPSHRIHLVKRSEKFGYAVAQNGYPNVLLDDYEKNIVAFRQAGGIGVQHIGARSSIEKLKRLGFRKA